MFGKLREPLALLARYRSDKPYSLTEHVIDADLRWSSGFSVWRRLNKDSILCITTIDLDVNIGDENVLPIGDEDPIATNSIDGYNGLYGHLCSDDEQIEGERTPSRSLRRRE